MHEIVAEIHMTEATSMDDTILYNHEKLNIETESSASRVLPSESSIPAVVPSETSILNVIPSEASKPNAEPTKTSVSSSVPTEVSKPTAILPEPPLPTGMISVSSIPTHIPSEVSESRVTLTESVLPTIRENTQQNSAAEKCLHNTKLEYQEKVTEKKSKEVKKARASTETSMNTRKDVKLSTSKGQPKKPKAGASEPTPTKIKNLVRDYHMPPGFKGGK